MTAHTDLESAARRMAGLVESVPDGVLDQPTPCERYAVGDLLDHISGFARGFTAAAAKAPLQGAPSGDAANLGPEWRVEIPKQVMTMAGAWREPEAWTGMTAAGGVELPAEVAGVVALDELVVHGWDLAKATDQPAGYDGPGLDAVYGMVQYFRAQNAEDLFGPLVEVPDDAPLLGRILGVTGRDPGWEPPNWAGCRPLCTVCGHRRIHDGLQVDTVLGVHPGALGSIMVEAVRRPGADRMALDEESQHPVEAPAVEHHLLREPRLALELGQRRRRERGAPARQGIDERLP